MDEAREVEERVTVTRITYYCSSCKSEEPLEFWEYHEGDSDWPAKTIHRCANCHTTYDIGDSNPEYY